MTLEEIADQLDTIAVDTARAVNTTKGWPA